MQDKELNAIQNIEDYQDDYQLLRRFVEQDCQDAFSQLMARHLNFVYSVCRREVGNSDLADDATQAVFLTLARKAATIRSEAALPGWLFKVARFACQNALREERRRQAAEQKAVQAAMVS